ncbi:protein translocase subunit SecF [Aliikangiella sp. IMCC44359]|uniref:protein translocase subunit SecF n=1 Tax=Aliikangiella sp. IMCC44359 TaxID=3459125 RepID=UPI00403ACE1C
MMNFLSKNISYYRYSGLVLSLIFIVFSMYAFLAKGLNLGVDFTGGFITEFSTSQAVTQSKVQLLLEKNIHGQFKLTSTGDLSNWSVRQPDVNDGSTSQSWLDALSQEPYFLNNQIVINALDSDYLGSQVGKELIEQGGLAMLTALIIIMLYLSARFEWRFAVGAILALIHDIILVLGLFAWTGLEFNLTVLASLLAIIGYSLNDSIIVSDRIRELMKEKSKMDLNKIINLAIASTFSRTLITSGTTLATIICIWWLAGSPLEGFSVALFSGVLVGTFSSICISATFPEVSGLDARHYEIKDSLDKEF